jgi:hypothetical protein
VTVINRRPQARTTTQKGPMRRVLIAYTLYDLVEMALWLAIIFYAYDRGGASLAGLAAVIQLVPAALLTPAIAGLGDGMPRGQALSLAHGSVGVAAVMTTVALFLDAPVAVVIAGAAAATLAVSVVRPFHFAALPMLAHNPAELVAANATSSVSDGFALFAGALIAGVGVQVAGPAQVFAGAAAAALLAAALCSGLELAAASAGGGGLRVAIDGFAILWRDWLAVVLLLALSMRFVILGALDVLSISFVEQLLGRGESSAGLILAAFGVGGAAGGIAAGRLATRPRLGPVIVDGGIVQGIAVACVAVFATVAPVMAALAVAGFGSAVLMVAGRTLLQRISDDRALARMFAVQETVSLVGLSLGAVLAPRSSIGSGRTRRSSRSAWRLHCSSRHASSLSAGWTSAPLCLLRSWRCFVEWRSSTRCRSTNSNASHGQRRGSRSIQVITSSNKARSAIGSTWSTPAISYSLSTVCNAHSSSALAADSVRSRSSGRCHELQP